MAVHILAVQRLVERWTALRTTRLAALNAKLHAAGQAPVVLPRVPRPRAPTGPDAPSNDNDNDDDG